MDRSFSTAERLSNGESVGEDFSKTLPVFTATEVACFPAVQFTDLYRQDGAWLLMLSKLLRLLRYDRDRQVYLPIRMTPFRMRLSVTAFLAIATAISINALYLQAPLKSDPRTGHGPSQPSGAAARARALITAALPGHEEPAKPAGERQEKPAAAPAVTTPAKEKPASEPPKPVKLEPSPVVRALQKKLTQFGYRGLPQDGLANPETRAAILTAEFEQGMPLSGEPGDAILKGLFFLEASGKTRLASTERFEADKALVKEVQDLLAKLGYSSGPVDGQLDAKTREAIRKFETDRRLKPDGRLGERILLEMVIEKGKPFLVKG
jgi:peptidoglycan hydrolase-like protein with peptidoglycan-binding domain